MGVKLCDFDMETVKFWGVKFGFILRTFVIILNKNNLKSYMLFFITYLLF